ncbi:hypothetical protein SETIT_2G009400v2 [Setaria italica]|uniref:F-box protein AT5G49610-like beta-propeller domain-containing protein n=1 Tax=Setaria italica TaxID=4555 RepID=K3ZU65_SETIT|nr:uncharacterized protein LOC101783693 [Setaria italica]RCV09214.1 hypothetical protein SETIT_2G009400v2 [Setaria italica]
MDAADPPPASTLMEELEEEVLLRFPPADPARLVAAALVCRRWCALLAGARFRRRFRELHRAPPLLGFLCNAGPGARFVPASAFRPPGLPRAGGGLLLGWRALDARHGRVLLRWDPGRDAASGGVGCPPLVVWDPVTDQRSDLPPLQWAPYPYSWNAAVLCAAGAACNHLDCCGGHFLVVVVGTNSNEMFAHVYSSEADAWSEPASARHPNDSVDFAPSALVGNVLYFAFQMGTAVLEYDLGTKEMAVIRLPPLLHFNWQRIALTTRTDGRLGFATADRSAIYLWSREACPGGDARWAQTRVIELDTLLPAGALSTFSDVVGFVDAIGLIFVRTGDGLFTIDLKSSQVTKVSKDTGFSGIFPYMNFHTPALGVPSAGEGPSSGA